MGRFAITLTLLLTIIITVSVATSRGNDKRTEGLSLFGVRQFIAALYELAGLAKNPELREKSRDKSPCSKNPD
jgi:hypothetical protein